MIVRGLITGVLSIFALYSVGFAYFSSLTHKDDSTYSAPLIGANTHKLSNKLTDDVRVLIAQAELDPVLRQSVVEDSVRLAKAAPLSPAPYASLGLIALRETALDDAFKFFKSAHIRNKRNLTSTRALISLSFANGDYAKGIAYLEKLSDVKYQREIDVVVSTLLTLSETTTARPTIIKGVLNDVQWKTRFIAELLKFEGDNPSLSLEIIETALQTQNDFDHVSLQSSVYKTLFRSKKFGQAHSLWKEFRQSTVPNYPWANNIVFDPDLQGYEIDVPFDWVLNTGLKNASAEFLKQGGLRVSHDSRKQGSVLARQYIALPEGQDYTLEIEASGNVDKRTGLFRVEILCAGRSNWLVRLDLAALDENSQSFKSDFKHTQADCDIALLLVRARLGAGKRQANATITKINILPK